MKGRNAQQTNFEYLRHRHFQKKPTLIAQRINEQINHRRRESSELSIPRTALVLWGMTTSLSCEDFFTSGRSTRYRRINLCEKVGLSDCIDELMTIHH
jgi:hypothetical protein